jgi:YjbE family integral membrane protein
MELGTAAALLQIGWVNFILSGDNAMVIALACRSLRGRERTFGIVAGASAAVILRIAFTLGLSEILFLPFARLIAGLLLLFIAVKLLIDDDSDSEAIEGHGSLWRAMGAVVVADMIMSLDNVVAIAAAARGSIPLIVFGLALSVPIVIAGSTLIVGIIKRFPLVVWVGSGFLGWIAGETVMSDNWVHDLSPQPLPAEGYGLVGAALVVVLGLTVSTWQSRRHNKSPLVRQDGAHGKVD